MIGLLFSLLASLVMAQQDFTVQEVAFRDIVIQSVLLDTGKATDVTAATSSGTLSGVWAVEVYNTSSTGTVQCGFSPSVTSSSQTAAGLAWYGREILPKVGMYWAFRQGKGSPAKNVYCKPQAVDGGTVVTVTQVK